MSSGKSDCALFKKNKNNNNSGLWENVHTFQPQLWSVLRPVAAAPSRQRQHSTHLNVEYFKDVRSEHHKTARYF